MGLRNIACVKSKFQQLEAGGHIRIDIQTMEKHEFSLRSKVRHLCDCVCEHIHAFFTQQISLIDSNQSPLFSSLSIHPFPSSCLFAPSVPLPSLRVCVGMCVPIDEAGMVVS